PAAVGPARGVRFQPGSRMVSEIGSGYLAHAGPSLARPQLRLILEAFSRTGIGYAYLRLSEPRADVGDRDPAAGGVAEQGAAAGGTGRSRRMVGARPHPRQPAALRAQLPDRA